MFTNKRGRTFTAQSRAKSIANLRKGPTPGQVIAPQNRVRPAPTPETADRYALLLHSGIPPLDALAMLHPQEVHALIPRYKDTMRREWAVHVHVRAALEAQAGKWETQTVRERLERGLEQNLCQCAYLLYTSNYLAATDLALDKIQDARRAITEYLRADTDSDQRADRTPFGEMLKKILMGIAVRDEDRTSTRIIDGVAIRPDVPTLPSYTGPESDEVH